MKKVSFLSVVALLLTAAVEVPAQTSPNVQSSPCADQLSLRPVLKRRQPQPDGAAGSEQAPPAAVDAPPCDQVNQNSGAAAASKPLTIRFEGLTAAPESDLRLQLREQRIGLSLESATDVPAAVGKAEAAIKEFLSDLGYRRAQVSSRLERSNDGSPVLTFVIAEGPRFEISDVRFRGNRIFPEPLLVKKINECLAGNQKDGRNVFRSTVFEYCSYRLLGFERSQGYLQARFGEANIQEVGEALIITIESNEGILYRVGNLEIEGADHVPEADIREMLGMHRGDIASGEKLVRTLYEDLKAVYGDEGFIQYTAEIEPAFRSEPGAAEGVVDFKIIIDEGQRFRIRKISFKGEDLPENAVRQLLLVSDGDVYSQKSFEESIRRINETGWFNRVDKDKDVDFRTNEEERLVDVVIKLTRREITSNGDYSSFLFASTSDSAVSRVSSGF